MKRTHRIRTLTCASPNLSLNRTLLGGPAARPSSRRFAWFVRPLLNDLTHMRIVYTMIACGSHGVMRSAS